MDFIIKELAEGIRQVKFKPYGILDASNQVYTLGTDSKILGRIFEMYTQPIIKAIADKHNLILKTPEAQTRYPDFILMDKEDSTNKIAIDIKSTYIKSDNSTIQFTLGSHTSYMQNNTKNIEYQYTDYSKHYVVGFIYKRNGKSQESQIVKYINRKQIELPFFNIKFFVQEKFKIAGVNYASGNTKNIGSFKTKNISDLEKGNGPFSSLGNDVFELYWKYLKDNKNQNRYDYSITDFITWFLKQKKEDVPLLHEYDYEKTRLQLSEHLI